MVGKFIDEQAANPAPELTALIKLLRLVAQGELYRQLVSTTLGKTNRADFDARRELLNAGHFLPLDLVQLVHACGGGQGTDLHFVSSILRQLVEWNLVMDATAFGPTSRAPYQWSAGRIQFFDSMSILQNVLLGPKYVATAYQKSVPAVFVEKEGDAYTGTGFLAAHRAYPGRRVVVTAKHNIDPAAGAKFISFNKPAGVSYHPMEASWIMHATLDIALMPVETSEEVVGIYPVGNPRILGRTISFGYPRIARTDDTYLLCHGGELNAIVRTYQGDERLIISNAVSPGNSGSPVLDEAGLCVGMVVDSFETHHQGGLEKANAAIPAAQIIDFISKYFVDLSARQSAD